MTVRWRPSPYQAPISRCHIDEPQLRPLDAVPAVEAQCAGRMHALPARLRKRAPKLLSDGAKSDGVEDRAVAGAQSHPHMRLSHLVGIDQGVRRKRNDRLGVARAEGPCAGDRRHDLVGRGRGGNRSVDQQHIFSPRGFDGGCERALEIGTEGVEPISLQRNARRHGMAAAFDEKPGAHGLAHGAAQRSEEHTSELQARENLVCRLLLEKKKKKIKHQLNKKKKNKKKQKKKKKIKQ